MSYYTEARSDAADTVEEYLDEIVEQLQEKGVASDDLGNDYTNGDAHHHENHVDKWYSLKDAAEVLSELSEWEEDDSGLWEGQAPKDAIATQAAFTYGNAVMSFFGNLISEINDDPQLGEILSGEDDGVVPDFAEKQAAALKACVESIVKDWR